MSGLAGPALDANALERSTMQTSLPGRAGPPIAFCAVLADNSGICCYTTVILRWHIAFMEIDETDCRILEILQKDGRISNQDLADRVGLSPSPCLRRTRLLESGGVVQKYVALLNSPPQQNLWGDSGSGSRPKL